MPPLLTNPAVHLALAAVLGLGGVYLLLPKPQRRSLVGGWFLVLAAVSVLAGFVLRRFGDPLPDLVGQVLFWFFSAAAVGFGVFAVTQRNPARGAIGFAFVILSVCGLFLLLAAPFLMAATVIIYAGAIIVTFLFLLMLSHVSGPSDENDRTREPLLACLAGFAFLGLILFTLHQSAPVVESETVVADGLPLAPISVEDRASLTEAYQSLEKAVAADGADDQRTEAEAAILKLKTILDPVESYPTKPHQRLAAVEADPRIGVVLDATLKLKATTAMADRALMNGDPLKPKLEALKAELLVYSGHGQLPARNVAAIGFTLYSEHLLAVEMAGTLLLVATVGAVAIAQRRKEAAA